jgi:glycosyltransferase involved in cell wall biosynthesis
MKMALHGRRVLFISYNGMLEALGQSQVIPYLRELSREGVIFTLLSFERPGAWQPGGRVALHERLASYGIEWHTLRYHKRFSLIATAYDIAAGVLYAARLARRNDIELVHARSHIPATIAVVLKRIYRIKMIFDLRGLMAEEYVDAQHWRAGSLSYRLTKTMERRAFGAADGIVTLTEAVWPIISGWRGLKGRAVAHAIVPCCADLERFRFDSEERLKRRADLGLSDRLVLVYSGSVGGWNLTEEMADFFAALLRIRKDAHFLWLSTSGHDRIEAVMKKRDIDQSKYTIRSAASADVPSYLSASDVGLVFNTPWLSRIASSPTKTAEYLGCGLPIVINSGIGDSDALVLSENVGALVRNLATPDYEEAAAKIVSFSEKAAETRRHSRAVAERLFDLSEVGLRRYSRLYDEVLD